MRNTTYQPQNVRPGKNPAVSYKLLTEQERGILEVLEGEWYITHGVNVISLNQKIQYKYFLMKLPDAYQKLFNLEREIVVIMNDYDNFEPRTLSILERINDEFQDLRIEKIVAVVISRDPRVQEKTQSLLRSDQENQVIIPFSYDEINNSISKFYYICERFKKYFYSRDLFAFQSPLKKDFYFFGRSELIHELVDRHENNESSGLFGLRKTGKTSIIFGIQRVLSRRDKPSVFIDCQNPALHQLRWDKALKYVIDEIKTQNKLEAKLRTADPTDQYTDAKAAFSFEKDMLTLSRKMDEQNLIMIFDEIEHISPDISPSEHWKSGSDFVFFWQTLRSVSQKHPSLFTYLIVGTNPKCTEVAQINGVDNPIFNQIPCRYIPSFSVKQTTEMVTTLGSIMGLEFDDIVCSKLTEDFGGHPFLIRKVCSEIHQGASSARPVHVDKGLYAKGIKKFRRQYATYIEMILKVLELYYRDEYDMLRDLAVGNIEQFEQLAALSNEYTDHLLGYNVIGGEPGTFSFKIEAIRNYLMDKNKHEKVKQSTEERWSEISERRNALETKLRVIVRQILYATCGEAEARKLVLDTYGGRRKELYEQYQYKDIFNPVKCDVYLEDMRKIIEKQWALFENIFGNNRNKFSVAMQTINELRRDAHAGEVSDEEMQLFRSQIKRLENFCETF